MYEIDKERFGLFLQELRKEKGFTQKELADRMFISDKAVSKWERGLSLPDTALLIPLSEILQVTVTELLKGEHLPENTQLPIADVERLMTNTLDIYSKERESKTSEKKKWKLAYIGCTVISLMELLCIYLYDATLLTNGTNLLLSAGMLVVFGAWFCLIIKETLPTYYDENRVTAYSDGILRMNLPGIRFHNGNWLHIVKVGRFWSCISMVLFPAVYFFTWMLLPDKLSLYAGFVMLPMVLGIFIPMIYCAKKYE